MRHGMAHDMGNGMRNAIPHGLPHSPSPCSPTPLGSSFSSIVKVVSKAAQAATIAAADHPQPADAWMGRYAARVGGQR